MRWPQIDGNCLELIYCVLERKTIRNVIVFIITALASGWMGIQADSLIKPQPEGETIGMGIWLVLPFLITIVLRIFGGDGWLDIGFRPGLKKNIRWYFYSVIIFPVVTALILAIGKVTGWISFSDFDTKTYLTGFINLLALNFFKNIFEEFVWRGYLTTKLIKLKTSDFWLYLIVGGVWGLWHLPYYLFFLPESQVTQILPVNRIIFALFAIIPMICWSVMFVELYRITHSIWSVVILHTIEDSLLNHLILDGHVSIVSGTEILISPVVGIIASILYLGVGLLLRKKRIEKERRNSFPDSFPWTV